MNVKLLETGKTAKLNTSYALRLIEQGKAVPVHVTAKKQTKKDAGCERAEFFGQSGCFDGDFFLTVI